MTSTPRQRIDALIAGHEGLRASVRHDLGVAVDGEASPRQLGLSSGFAAIDDYLPWQGWPLGAMTEILTTDSGRGELSLLLPALAKRTDSQHQIVVIGASHALYAAGLQHAGVNPHRVQQVGYAVTGSSGGSNASANSRSRHIDALWAAEQVLKSGAAGAVLLWSRHCAPDALRRLHLAVLQQDTALFHFREPDAAMRASPAWLRLKLDSDPTRIRLQVLKCRGQLLSRPLITLDRSQVQARVYQQLHGNRVLDQVVRFGVHHRADVEAQALIDALGQTDTVPGGEAPRVDRVAPAAPAARLGTHTH